MFSKLQRRLEKNRIAWLAGCTGLVWLLAFAYGIPTVLNVRTDIAQTGQAINRAARARISFNEKAASEKLETSFRQNPFLTTSKLARAHGVSIVDFHPVKNLGGTVEFEEVRIKVEGNYKSIVRYIHQLEKLPISVVSAQSVAAKYNRDEFNPAQTILTVRYTTRPTTPRAT